MFVIYVLFLGSFNAGISDLWLPLAVQQGRELLNLNEEQNQEWAWRRIVREEEDNRYSLGNYGLIRLIRKR